MACNGDSTTLPKAFGDLTGTCSSAQLPGGPATGSGAIVMTASPTIATPNITGACTSQRYNAHNGTALITADYVLSAGWGTSPVFTAVRGTDQAATFTIQAKATVGANPTVTLTFKNGTWITAPIVVPCRTELVAATGAPAAAVSNEWVPTSVTATQVVFTFNGTPVANSVYGCSFIVMGV